MITKLGLEAEFISDRDSVESFPGWELVSEDSISGWELVSPVMDYWDFHKQFHSCMNFLRKPGYFSTDQCGLHVNVSFEDADITRMDRLKAILELGEQHQITRFERDDPLSVQSHLEFLEQELSSKRFFPLLGTSLKDIRHYRDSVISCMSEDKFFSLNFGRLNQGWIECRYMGGQNYQYREKEILAEIDRLIDILWSCTKNNYDKRYLKQLYRFSSRVRELQES